MRADLQHFVYLFALPTVFSLQSVFSQPDDVMLLAMYACALSTCCIRCLRLPRLLSASRPFLVFTLSTLRDICGSLVVPQKQNQ